MTCCDDGIATEGATEIRRDEPVGSRRGSRQDEQERTQTLPNGRTGTCFLHRRPPHDARSARDRRADGDMEQNSCRRPGSDTRRVGTTPQRANRATEVRHCATRRSPAAARPDSRMARDRRTATLLHSDHSGRTVSMPMVTRVFERVSSSAVDAAPRRRPRAAHPCRVPGNAVPAPHLAAGGPVLERGPGDVPAALDQLVAEGVLVLGRFGYMRA